MIKFKYLKQKEKDPYRNLALEEMLVDSLNENEIIVYLWQNAHTIVIGKHQDVYAECKVDEFIATGGRIARRNSGGGAVYHDLGNLNFSIIASRKHQNLCDYRDMLKKVLLFFGLTADYNGRNDLLIEGHKFSGNAAYVSKEDVICQHGTILINADISVMNSFLTPDKSKLKRNAVPSVAARVANLSEFCGEITVESISDQFIAAFDMEPLDKAFDKKKLNDLEQKYSSANWIFRGQK